MALRFPRSLAVMAAALALAGCRAAGPFPSLAPRAGERDLSATEPVRPAPEVARDPALAARIAELEGLARQGERDFETALGPAQAAAGAAGAANSESWISAQEALSRLEAARAETTRALAELDQLALRRADLPTSAEDHSAILAALDRVERLTERQQSRIDRLRAAISGR